MLKSILFNRIKRGNCEERRTRSFFFVLFRFVSFDWHAEMIWANIQNKSSHIITNCWTFEGNFFYSDFYVNDIRTVQSCVLLYQRRFLFYYQWSHNVSYCVSVAISISPVYKHSETLEKLSHIISLFFVHRKSHFAKFSEPKLCRILNVIRNFPVSRFIRPCASFLFNWF